MTFLPYTQVACVEAEEIARLAVDLERAVRAAKAEADKRRNLEERLAAAEARLTKRSRSPVRSPRGTGGGTGVRGEREGGQEGGRAHSAGFHAGEAFRASLEEDGGKKCTSGSSLPPPRGALGSTVASRGRSAFDGPATGPNGRSGGLKGGGRSSVSPRRKGSAEKVHRRPWGSSPPPSPRRKADGSGASAAASRHRSRVDGEAASAERKNHRRRLSEERLFSAERDSTSREYDPGWRRGTSANPPARKTAKEPPGRENRHPSVVRREEGSPTSSTERLRGTRDAPPATVTDTTAAEVRRRTAQGTPMVGVEALRGVDLTAKIAQELRAAVATTPASAVSPGYFSDGSRGQNAPAGDGGDERRGNILGCPEGDLLKTIWQGTSQYALDGDNRKPIAAMRSREVAELESDVQHIFQFFAAKDGRKRSEMSAAGRGEIGEADFIPE